MATVEPSKPLILTLQMDAAAQAFFDDLRSRHFPSEINYLRAHLTLFHQLPGAEARRVIEIVGQAAAQAAPFVMRATGPLKLGRGVAIRIESPALLLLRRDLADAFTPWLVAQDRQGFRPHVTIQNKVDPAHAAGLYAHLEHTMSPFSVTAEGLQLWIYEGGPWSPFGAIAFKGTTGLSLA